MYVIFTDTDTDMTPEMAKQYGINLISMPYIFDDNEVKPYESWEEFDAHTYYDQLRTGLIPKTSGLSPVTYQNYFEKYLQDGNDILYIHFSKEMSGTFSALNIAVEDLKEKYPDRTIYLLDTKGISINSLILIEMIMKKKAEGYSLEQLIEYGEKERENCATYFYADDLKFFAKSGRVSNFSALMGGIIGIKPIIYMDQNGKMTSISKCKGKVKTLNKILEYIEQLQDNIQDYPVIIAHSDNIDIANTMAEMLKEKFGKDLKIEMVMVNPTAGAHCGPDCMGVAFHAIHR